MSEDQVRQKCMFVFATSHVFLKDLILTIDDLAELGEFIILLLGSHIETTMRVRAMFLYSTSFNHEHTTVLALLACFLVGQCCPMAVKSNQRAKITEGGMVLPFQIFSWASERDKPANGGSTDGDA